MTSRVLTRAPEIPARISPKLETPLPVPNFHSLVNKIGNNSHQYPGNEADNDTSDPAAEFPQIIKGSKNKGCDCRIHGIVNETGKAKKQSQARSLFGPQEQGRQYNGDVDNSGSCKSQRDISEKRG